MYELFGIGLGMDSKLYPTMFSDLAKDAQWIANMGSNEFRRSGKSSWAKE